MSDERPDERVGAGENLEGTRDAPPDPPPPPSPPSQSQAPPPPAGGEGGPGASISDEEARTWAMLAHLGGLFLFVGPLVVWLVKKDAHPFVADQSREALNFQLTVTIFAVVAFVLNLIPLVNCIFGIVSLAVFLADVVLIILAAVKANDGERYRYPLALRLLN